MKKVILASAQARKWFNFRSTLTASGYEMTMARTGAQFWENLMLRPVDAIVLDASIADVNLDPWRLLRDLSPFNHLLIVLTRGGRNLDRVRAFQFGAHHCLTLPVTPLELGACLGAAFSNGPDRDGGRTGQGRTFYADSELQIDFANRQIRRQDHVFPLTERECPVLQRLIQGAGNIIPSEELVEICWGAGAWPSKRDALKTYILQLRRKIERNTRRHRYIVSRRGLGYAFVPRRVRDFSGMGS